MILIIFNEKCIFFFYFIATKYLCLIIGLVLKQYKIFKSNRKNIFLIFNPFLDLFCIIIILT